MAVTLTLTGKTPSNTQFGLDAFAERYKCDATADVVLTDAGVPHMGDAHPDYPFMFVTGRPCYETGESASDLIYTGCLTDDGDGNPILPAQQSEFDNAVQSATSSRGIDGTILTSPISVQFYAPCTKLTFMSFGGRGALGTVADPTDEIQIITVVIGDTSYSPTGLLADIVANFFRPLITDTMSSPEIVAGQFWQNTEIKTLSLSPPIFTASSGNYIVQYAPGSGYTVGNTLTITDGTYTAVIVVSVLGVGNSVRAWTVSSNSFNYSTTAPLYASGGSGSGTGFWFVQL